LNSVHRPVFKMETESLFVGMGKGGEARTELGPTVNLFSITGKSVSINYLYMRYWVHMQVVIE
jgi:hypothetical protein